MDCITVKTFDQMVEEAGVRRRQLYPVRVVALVVGVPTRTLYDEVHAGRLTSFLPKGREKGALIRPEWVDQWLEEGTTGRMAPSEGVMR